MYELTLHPHVTPKGPVLDEFLQQVLVYQNFILKEKLFLCWHVASFQILSQEITGSPSLFYILSVVLVVVCPSTPHLAHTLINTHWHKTPDETSPHTFSHQSTHSSSWCVALCSNEDVHSVQLSETQFLFEVCSTPSSRSLLRAQVPPELLLLLLLLLQVERWL